MYINQSVLESSHKQLNSMAKLTGTFNQAHDGYRSFTIKIADKNRTQHVWSKIKHLRQRKSIAQNN